MLSTIEKITGKELQGISSLENIQLIQQATETLLAALKDPKQTLFTGFELLNTAKTFVKIVSNQLNGEKNMGTSSCKTASSPELIY